MADGLPLDHGLNLLKEQVRQLPDGPGVYRMLDGIGDALYVGKARNLKRRVTNYTQVAKLPRRLQRMVAEIRAFEIVRTHTEVEALLLEANMIKQLMPRYNVLLRDDKSFPYILMTDDHPFPRLVKHRGARNRAGDYFGPFASAGAVNRTLVALQKAFMIRNCSDHVFASRTRPCLQFHIKRCTAPCVDHIDGADYNTQIEEARQFLTGKSRAVQDRLSEEMRSAAEAMDFEHAARLRDRIRAMTAIQGHQDINVDDITNADIVACHLEGGSSCIQVFFVRGGYNYGNRAFFPSHDRDSAASDILAAFLSQFYDNKPPPPLILLSEPPAEAALLSDALTVRAGRKVTLTVPKRSGKRRLVDLAGANAREALARRMAETSAQAKLLRGVADAFGLDAAPKRIDVFDNSHIQGTHAVGGMVVAGPDGFMKTSYRLFNIKNEDLAPGDDFGMMREVLSRRLARAAKEDPERTGGGWPDLMLIDGGQGQLSVAIEVLASLGIDDVPVVAIAKGPDRNAGRERFFVPDQPEFSMPPNDPVLYYLQRLRDEVAGIGPKRKAALLKHFGSGKAVTRAGLADLEAVDGINTTMAQKIYDFFHGES
jgi:excinuclease ABC subunit C